MDRLQDLYIGLIDNAIPPRILDGNPDQLRQARTIIGFTLTLIFLGVETIYYFQHVLPLEAANRLEISFAIAMAMTLAIPFILRMGGSLELAANLVIAGSFLVIVVCFTLFGGVRSPLLHWAALPPMLAVLMGARRSAWVWALASCASLVGLVAVEAYDLEMQAYFDIAELQGAALWAQRSVDLVSWLVILLSVSFLYERLKDAQTRELAIANEELTHEINQRKMAEERTRYLAYYDELTTLPNRQLFKEQLSNAMERADREDRLVALFFLDLDGFKEINDSHGHDFGDQLLQQVARRLLHCVRAVDAVGRVSATENEESEEGKPNPNDEIVSRLGGDEFTLLLDGIKDFNEAALVARRVIDSLSAPIDLSGEEVYITASIGIALYPGTPTKVDSMDELLRNADLAMYHAKANGRNNFQFFEPAMNDAVKERSTLAQDLRGALENGEFELDYQPIIHADRLDNGEPVGELAGVEALVRWRHPERGRVMPDQFIQVAEESGLIVHIGEWVLREACQQYAKWRVQGIAPKRISVNVSGNQFRSQRLAGAVIGALEESEMAAENLELEITESAMMLDEGEAARCMHLLSDLGVRIAFDDFGTGYSSLSHIKRFPVHTIKIDRSFVGYIESDTQAQAISTAIIAMAHSLGLGVVAEGVETQAQERFLREHDCDELQGYRFSRPLSREDATDFLIEALARQPSVDGQDDDAPPHGSAQPDRG